MKKSLCLILALVLMMACTSAFAAKLSSTQAYLDILDANDVTYTLSSMADDAKNERVKIAYTSSTTPKFDYDINCFFNTDLQDCALRVWNLIAFSDADFAKVLRACNTLNNDYRFATFEVDESDNTVTVSMDIIFRSNDVADIMWEATQRLCDITERGYEVLSVYSK